MRDLYENPLNTRYASSEMSHIFSDDNKFCLWRKLWIALAESEMEMGLPIKQSQIDEMKKYVSDINYDVANQREKEVKHDVMAHVYAFGQQAVSAKPIIHLGATSCFVTDNADVIEIADALKLVKSKLVSVIKKLSNFAYEYKDVATLGYTHLQPAQLTTVGKRACLWIQDLCLDYESLCEVIAKVRLRGVKGTTGTQASFLDLLGSEEKVRQLENKVVKKMGYDKAYAVTGQTYPRKFDYNVLSVLSQIAQSAYKFGNDLRLLQSMKEMEEPFEKNQIGSSAMAYKRNPMRSERMCALARYVISLPTNEAVTAATQWMERTLDDSANRRITIAQAFLAVDGILNIYNNIVSGIVVYRKMIQKRVKDELPFMATENIIMECVKHGGDRQELHERIRIHSMESGKRVKEGESNDLIERIKADEAFAAIKSSIDDMLSPEQFIGLAAKQTERFIDEVVSTIIRDNGAASCDFELKV
ncbi:adenylosuccinate lyase [Firmicutes bacterium CAG:552]|nr:adenylosuccinate lyase [Firmicutes bacterium CAG:552]